MAQISEVIRRMRFQYVVEGDREVVAAAERNGRSIDNMNAAYQRLVDQQTKYQRTLRDQVAVNDNLARSSQSATDAVTQSNSSFLSTGAAALSTAAHLKGLALVAYAASPAFRSLVNPAVAQGLALIGSAAVTAGAVAMRALTPLLAFLTRIGAPILAIAAAWQALNYVIQLGSGLLDKYGNAERNLVSGVDDSLKKLTKFQDDQLSAAQVQYATELGTRLAVAKQTISDFFRVQLDLTNPALKLQNIWVVIVEVIAKAVQKIEDLINLMGRFVSSDTFLKILSTVPGLGAPFMAARVLNAVPGPSSGDVSQADTLSAARRRLAAGMGATSNFANRFGQAVNDLANPSKPEEPKPAVSDAWIRYVDQVNKANAAVEANTKTVGLGAQAHEQLKVQLQGESILERAGVADTAARRKALQELANAAGEAALALEKAKLANQFEFDRKTSLLGPDDVRIAQQLKGIYGNDVPAALASTEAAAMRVNSTYKEFGNFLTTASSQLTTGLADIFDGTKSVSQGFADMSKAVLRSLEEMIIKMMIVEPIMRSLRAGLSSFVPGLASAVAPAGFTAADGGTFGAGRWGMVGERGPELIQTHFGGGVSIYDHSRSMSMLAGGLPGFAVGGFLPAPVSNMGGLGPATVNLTNKVEVINNHPTGQVKTAEVPDGYGGRKTQIVLSEMVANGIGVPGGAADQSLRSRGVAPLLRQR